jgi:hypothetical protein
MVRRFLVVPLLAPWLLVLLVAGLNPRPPLSLRLLVWTSPALPIGTWLALVSSGGALLSFSATALTLQGRRSLPPRSPGAPAVGGGGRWNRRRAAAARGPSDDDWLDDDSVVRAQPPVAAAGPGRSPGEPAPTVSVPFRVIRRGSRSDAGAGVQETATAAPGPASAWRRWGPFGVGAQQAAPTAASGLDGWGDEQADDW